MGVRAWLTHPKKFAAAFGSDPDSADHGMTLATITLLNPDFPQYKFVPDTYPVLRSMSRCITVCLSRAPLSPTVRALAGVWQWMTCDLHGARGGGFAHDNDGAALSLAPPPPPCTCLTNEACAPGPFSSPDPPWKTPCLCVCLATLRP